MGLFEKGYDTFFAEAGVFAELIDADEGVRGFAVFIPDFGQEAIGRTFLLACDVHDVFRIDDYSMGYVVQRDARSGNTKINCRLDGCRQSRQNRIKWARTCSKKQEQG